MVSETQVSSSSSSSSSDPTPLAVQLLVAVSRSCRLSFLVRRPTKPAATLHFSFSCYVW
uniref:Uncharacterized protein n=1 Tax=Cucumis melo TaxID=3656 RepID=A0A9I9DGU7_CUCME